MNCINHEFLVNLRRLFETMPNINQNLKLNSNKINLIYDADP